MLTLIYRQRNGSDAYKDFIDPIKAFDKFFSMVNDARKMPFITSDEHIGSFDHRNVEWYMLNDQEGKELALTRFNNWLKDFRR